MPLLQVRDCPADLYDALKREASAQKRSVAQTIVALESCPGSRHGGQGLDTAKERRRRIMDSLVMTGAQGFDLVEIVRESRDER